MPQVGRTLPLLVALLVASLGAAQGPIQEAGNAYEAAVEAEARLRETLQSDRARSDYLQVIRLYERVYLITPHTGYADDALLNIASLYEDIDEPGHAITTLRFLVREYPGSRYVRDAEREIARLGGAPSSEPVESTSQPAESASTGPVSVNNIRYWESSSSLRVVVDMDGKPEFSRGEADDPPRVYIDIADARVSNELRSKEFPVESVMLENIRIAQYDAETVRVVLDLMRLSDVSAFTLEGPDRLVIDVLGDAADRGRITEDRAPSPASPGQPPNAEQPPPTAIEEPVRTAEDRISIPAAPNGNGDHSLVRSLGLKVGRVVIDPGHGGRDSGTIGPSGLTEKELVLDIANRLKAQIETVLGAEVVLTREGDTFVPLETRTAIANQSEADLFLSIHANSSRARSIRGFETYFLNLTTSREAMELAARENAASQASISELQDIVRQIMLRDKLDESKEFATHVQQALASQTQLGRDRGVKQAPFVVLIGANMPSILAEISFISNPEDEQLLRGETRRQEIAEALFEGVRSYAETLSGFRTAQVQD